MTTRSSNASLQNRNLITSEIQSQEPSGDISILALDTTDDDRDEYAVAPVRSFNCFVLSHIFAGQGRLWLPDYGEFMLEPGSTVLIPPGLRNLYGSLSDTGYREDIIMFDGGPIRRMMALGLLVPGIGRLGPVRRLQEFNRLMSNPTAEARWRLGLMLQSLLLEIHSNGRHRRTTSRLELLQEAIRNDHRHWWTLEEMAAFCNQSETQFRRSFVNAVGMNPKHFLEEIKLREAARKLVETSLPIESIAGELGYRDRFHFSRRFKMLFGQAPAQYRLAHPMR